MPAAQGRQLAAPAAEEKVPGAHCEHEAEPAAAELPAAQTAHPPAAGVPGLVTAPAYPAAQTLQAATEVWPEEAVPTPGGQLVHAAAPASE